MQQLKTRLPAKKNASKLPEVSRKNIDPATAQLIAIQVDLTAARCRLDSQFVLEDFVAECITIAEEKQPSQEAVLFAFERVRENARFPVKPGDFEMWLARYVVPTKQAYKPHWTDGPLKKVSEADRAEISAGYKRLGARLRTHKQQVPAPDPISDAEFARRMWKIHRVDIERPSTPKPEGEAT